MEKDEDGVEMMGFTENGRKRLLYGPKIQLQKEVTSAEDEKLQLMNLMDQSATMLGTSTNQQLIGDKSLHSLQNAGLLMGFE